MMSAGARSGGIEAATCRLCVAIVCVWTRLLRYTGITRLEKAQ